MMRKIRQAIDLDFFGNWLELMEKEGEQFPWNLEVKS
jgi:hypothetical protein